MFNDIGVQDGFPEDYPMMLEKVGRLFECHQACWCSAHYFFLPLTTLMLKKG